MSDIIQLLPENVANQIAAGEVVQRPASAIKELVENAIDAKGTSIQVVVKDAGKTLIQVIDNGSGMSAQDARMCFERHATSKLKKSEDLFQIVTKGFRGEALASIAAIAQVEMKTRLRGEDLGTRIEVEGTKFKGAEPDACPEGTNISVKNLFYNVPARRYFLKSDAIELKHIIDEIQRIALTHPDVEFKLSHNGSEVFSYPKATLRQRIVHVLGSKYNEKLVPVDEHTDIVGVTGYVGKPEASKKTRGEQFIFVNQRFIRSTYLNHAIVGAFDQLLGDGHFPLYLIYLEIDPGQIDINIHPTKTEIKFQDERAIYAILHAAIKRALGRHNISPTLDFNQETAIQIDPISRRGPIAEPKIDINPNYNPFEVKPKRESLAQGWFDNKQESRKGWQELLEISRMVNPDVDLSLVDQKLFDLEEDFVPFQWNRKYVIVPGESDMLIVDQQRAHRRVLFERYSACIEKRNGNVQQLLFPEVIDLGEGDFQMVKEVLEDIRALGFEIEEFGGRSFQVLGIPTDANVSDAERLLHEFIENLKHEQSSLGKGMKDQLAWAMAVSTSIRYGQMLTMPEMKDLLQRLMNCAQPQFAQGNKSVYIRVLSDQIDQQFK